MGSRVYRANDEYKILATNCNCCYTLWCPSYCQSRGSTYQLFLGTFPIHGDTCMYRVHMFIFVRSWSASSLA